MKISKLYSLPLVMYQCIIRMKWQSRIRNHCSLSIAIDIFTLYFQCLKAKKCRRVNRMKLRNLFILFFFLPFSLAADDFSLPIWKEKAEAMGYTLPKPIGFNLSYMAMEQGVEVDSIAMNGLNIFGKPIPVEGSGKGKQYTDILSLRADVWVLPFLNLYGLVGKLGGHSTADVDLAIGSSKKSLQVPVSDFRLELDGYTYGVGGVLAGGYQNWFALIDASFTQSRLTVIDGSIDSIVVSPRIGYDFVSYGHPVRLWVGAMYQNVEQTLRGSVSDLNLPSSISNMLPKEARFEVKQHLTSPWNALVGLQYQITPSWYLLGELGFGDRQSIFFTIDRRF